MKKFLSRAVIALVLCALAGSTALAKTKSQTITFGTDFVVGSTLVKKGTYKLSYDDQAGVLSVFTKEKELVAKTAARMEKRKSSSFGIEVILAQKGESQALVSVAFSGDKDSIVVNGTDVAQK